MTALENILVGQHQHLHTTWFQAVVRTKGQRTEEAEAIEESHRLLDYVGLGKSYDLLARNLPYGGANTILRVGQVFPRFRKAGIDSGNPRSCNETQRPALSASGIT